MTDAVAALLAHQIDAQHCPGALALVEQDGQPLARHAAGRVRPERDTPMHAGVRFRIASLTKPVVSLVALQLVDEGRLALDTPVAEHLSALRGVRLASGAAPQRPPTVRDLLRHTSGWAYPWEVPTAAVRAQVLAAGFSTALDGLDGDDFLARLATLPLVDEPGTRFRYGYSTDVLGLLLERLSGQPLPALLAQRVCTPLGMAATGFEIAADTPEDQLASAHAADKAWHAMVPPIGQPRRPGQAWMASGGGGLVSTLDDYAAFARLLAHGGIAQNGPARGQRLLSEAGFADLARQQLPDGVDGPNAYCGPGWGFGLGLAVRADGGPAAMPSAAGELAWSGISGTALFVQPSQRWFALLLSANMATRMMARMAFRHAASQLPAPRH